MKKNKNPLGESVVETLTFELTEKEIAGKAESAAETQNELTEVSAQFRDVSTNFKDKIKGLQEEIRSHLNCIHSGEEQRDTECTKVLNKKTNMTEFWFEGVCMKERPTTDWDRQAKLPMNKKPFNPVISETVEVTPTIDTSSNVYDAKKRAANDD